MKNSLLLIASLALLPSAVQATLTFVPINITGGTASQSTSHPAGPAGNGIDGNLGNFTHTNGGDPAPSWSTDFGVDHTFNRIIVHNRDSCCANRLSDITVQVFDSGAGEVYNSGVLNAGNGLGSPAFIGVNLPSSVTGRSVTVSRDPASNPDQGILSIGELQIGAISNVIFPLGTDLTRANIFNMSVAQAPTSASPPGGGFATNAVDGNLANFTHTNANVNVDHTWQVDFGEEMLLENISMFNRSNCCGERLRDITVSVLDGGGGTVFTSALLNPGNALNFSGTNQPGLDVDFSALNGGNPIIGQTVVITRTTDAVGPNNDDRSVLSLGEVTIIGGSIPEPSATLLTLVSFLCFSLRRRRS